MKSEIVSTSYPAPFSQHQQSIIEFIRKTQADYLSKIIRVCLLVPNSLNPNESGFNKTEFDEIYLLIRAIVEYCKDNGMIFEEPKFHNNEQLKVIIYDDKKYKKELEKTNQGRLAKMFDKFMEKISPSNAKPANPTADNTFTDIESTDDADGTASNANQSSNRTQTNTQNNTQTNTQNNSQNDTPTDNPQTNRQANPEHNQHKDKPVQPQPEQTQTFDKILSECIKIQIEQISDRLIAFNQTAEEAGIRSVCKLKQISIRPIDQDQSTQVDTAQQLANFLTFYAGEKRKVIYLKQVMAQISPVLINYFNVEEVVIVPQLEEKTAEAEVINPFASLTTNNLNTETNTKIIDERWEVNLDVNYFDQDIDVMSEAFKHNKLKQADVQNLDMQLSIQDHLYHGKHARVITAPSYDFIIGRSDDADVQIFGDEVAVAGMPKFSRQHLRVQKNGNQWMVTCMSQSPVLLDGTEVMRANDSKIIKKTMSARLGTATGIGTGEYGIYPEITFNVASKSFAVQITDPSALNQSS